MTCNRLLLLPLLLLLLFLFCAYCTGGGRMGLKMSSGSLDVRVGVLLGGLPGTLCRYLYLHVRLSISTNPWETGMSWKPRMAPAACARGLGPSEPRQDQVGP